MEFKGLIILVLVTIFIGAIIGSGLGLLNQKYHWVKQSLSLQDAHHKLNRRVNLNHHNSELLSDISPGVGLSWGMSNGKGSLGIGGLTTNGKVQIGR